jgi:lipoate-protein ligase A
MKTDSVYTALELLKQGNILIEEKKRTIIFMKDQKIHLKNTQWNSKISSEDFLSLFEDAVFSTYEKKKDAEISDEKDIEYYTWREKYQ